jgi:hypothetical protein
LRFHSTNGTSGARIKKTFTHEQLYKALIDSYDLMRRVLLENIYIAAGDTAKNIYNGMLLSGDGLDFIIEKKYITLEVLSTLREYATPSADENGFTYIFEKVPVRFKFIEKKYPFFEYPDTKMYQYEMFKIANPFQEYWKVRGLIQ